MAKAEIQIREAGVEDAAAIARLLHDFNSEYEEQTPPVPELTGHAERMLREGEITVLLAGVVPARALYRKLGFTNEEGPDGAAMLYYEREI